MSSLRYGETWYGEPSSRRRGRGRLLLVFRSIAAAWLTRRLMLRPRRAGSIHRGNERTPRGPAPGLGPALEDAPTPHRGWGAGRKTLCHDGTPSHPGPSRQHERRTPRPTPSMRARPTGRCPLEPDSGVWAHRRALRRRTIDRARSARYPLRRPHGRVVPGGHAVGSGPIRPERRDAVSATTSRHPAEVRRPWVPGAPRSVAARSPWCRCTWHAAVMWSPATHHGACQASHHAMEKGLSRPAPSLRVFTDLRRPAMAGSRPTTQQVIPANRCLGAK